MKLTDIRTHADMVAAIERVNAGAARMAARTAEANEAAYGNPNGSVFGPGVGTN